MPEAEKKAAREMMAKGPSKTSGTAGINKLGTAVLDGEFDSPAGLVLRAREIIFEPGGWLPCTSMTDALALPSLSKVS